MATDRQSEPAVRTDSVEDRHWLVPAITYGALAAILTHLTVVIFLAVEMMALTDATIGGLSAKAFLFGTLGDFYGMHFGAMTGHTFGIRRVEMVPAIAYYVVPVCALVWCGRQCAIASKATSAWRRLLYGGSIVAGYALLVLGTLTALAVGFESGLTGVDPRQILLVAGVFYPIVWGTIGGALTAILD